MIENQIAQQLIQEQLERQMGEQAAPPVQPEEGATQQFEQAMASPNDPNTVQSTDPVDGVERVAPTEAVQPSAPAEVGAPANPGDNLLDSLDRMRSSHAQQMREVNQRLEAGDELSVSDLLKAQMDISQLGFEQDMAAKAAGKVSQSVDSLLKGQ